MRQRYITAIVFGLLLLFTTGNRGIAGETGHYPLASKGLRGSTLPQAPGYYLEMFHILYTADQSRDKRGNRAHDDTKISSFAYAYKLNVITDKKLFGADYGFAICAALVYADVEVDKFGISDSDFTNGDVFLEPIILGWHGARYDMAFSLAAWAPWGKYDRHNPASAGKGFWSPMVTLGLTWYFDEEKKWHFSALSRTEIHGKKRHTNIRPGSNFSLEWGLGKRLAENFDAGVAGYCQWQFTDDSGSDAAWDRDTKDRVFAVGPEVHYFFKSANLDCSLRVFKEFGAVDRPQGNIFSLVLTKIF